MNICPVCGGNLEPMGYLGKIFWRRCENCGMQFGDNGDDYDPDDDIGEDDDFEYR